MTRGSKLIGNSVLMGMIVLFSQTYAAAPEVLHHKKMKDVAVKKANIMIQGVSWERENCTGSCPQVKQDLKINKVNCNFRVRVANSGNKSTGTFRVRLLYTHWMGGLRQKVKWLGTGLAAKNNGAWVKDVVFTNIGYYRTDQPFKMTVDWGNDVPESNESDNEHSQLML